MRVVVPFKIAFWKTSVTCNILDQKKSEPQSKEPDQKLNQSDENKKTAESQTKDNQSSKTDDSSENQSNQSEKQSETGSGSQRSETPNLSRPATPLKNQQV